jgi:hypothetical protein
MPVFFGYKKRAAHRQMAAGAASQALAVAASIDRQDACSRSFGLGSPSVIAKEFLYDLYHYGLYTLFSYFCNKILDNLVLNNDETSLYGRQ